ncbi:hypothetical protein EVG20_g8848, partial [Dentipellis fragilis]
MSTVVENPPKAEATSAPAASNSATDAPAETKPAQDVVMASADAATETEEERKARAVRQIEFYFADANLPFDKFMWTLHTKNEDHWVPIETVASFKRMREFSDNGVQWVTDALRTSTELEVDADGKNVRRTTEVQEPKGQFDRSIYAKGFGKEEPGLQQKLEKFFEQYGRVSAVRMRRVDNKKAFKARCAALPRVPSHTP